MHHICGINAMSKGPVVAVVAAALLASSIACAAEPRFETEHHDFKLVTVARGLEQP